MTVALFLELCQILAAMGGAGVAFLTIKKDLEERIAAGTIKLADPLPAEHEAVVRAALAPAQSQGVWDSTHAGE